MHATVIVCVISPQILLPLHIVPITCVLTYNIKILSLTRVKCCEYCEITAKALEKNTADFFS